MYIIQIDDTKTYPKALVDLLIELIQEEKNYDEENKNKHFNIGSIENAIHIQTIRNIENDIEDLLKSCYIICYHSTRLTNYDIQDIKNNGLKLLDKEEHKNRIINNVKRLGIDKENVIKLEEHINKYDYEKREGKIYFVHSLKTIRNDLGSKTFLEYYGGEIGDKISNDYTDIRNKLSEISNPFIIKFKIPYNKIYGYFSIDNMKKSISKIYTGYGGGCTLYNINKEDIIEIIDAKEILNGLKTLLKEEK